MNGNFTSVCTKGELPAEVKQQKMKHATAMQAAALQHWIPKHCYRVFEETQHLQGIHRAMGCSAHLAPQAALQRATLGIWGEAPSENHC